MLPEPYILAFDTSAAHCAAALLCGTQVVAQRFEAMEKGQAERLMGLLEEVLAEAGIGWRDLAALAVGTGPGNFTGIRISVAAARGLALGVGIPAIGVDAFAAAREGLTRPALVSLDARRDMLFLAEPGVAPVMAGIEDVPAHLAASGLDVVGYASDTLAKMTGGKVVQPLYPVAIAIGLHALSLHQTPQPRPAPLYLRSADAAPPSDPPPVILP